MALYQTYRPLTFGDVIGQTEAVRILSSAVHGRSVPHAVMFAGTHGTGKTTLARLVAAGLCCSESDKPCGQCDECRDVQRGQHPDVWELDAASNRGVDDARRINDRIMHAPMIIGAHVIILDEAHMLTRDAQNALLKTIEEPATPVHIMLCTTEAHKVLPTIRSRCQRYALRKPTDEDLVVALERVVERESLQYDNAGLAAVAHVAGGSFRDALSLAEQVLGGYGDLHEASVTAALDVPQRDVLSTIANAWLSGDRDRIHGSIEAVSAAGANWTLVTNELAHHAAERLLAGEDARLVDLIGACDRTLQSALPFPLALEYQLIGAGVLSGSSNHRPSEPARALETERPAEIGRNEIPSDDSDKMLPARPARAASAPEIGQWSAARLAVMLPLIAIAARTEQPEIYLALRTAQATARGKRLRLFSREFSEAPDGIEPWIAKWGEVKIEWHASRQRIPNAPAEGPSEAAATAESGTGAATGSMDKASGTEAGSSGPPAGDDRRGRTTPSRPRPADENDIDATLAELGILAVDDDHH